MLKKIFNIFKRFIFAGLLIYAYNKMTLPLNIYVPMNVLTIMLVTFCGIPSIIMLILYSLVFI